MTIEINKTGKYYLVKDIASIKDVTIMSVQNWIRQGILPAVDLGGKGVGYLVHADDLAVFTPPTMGRPKAVRA